MNLDLLRAFVSVAETRSYSKAAEQLYLTQSTVSRQIAALEADMGNALFLREHRTIQLTEAGRILLEDAYTLLRQYSTLLMHQQAHSAQSEVKGCLKLGFCGLTKQALPRDLESELKIRHAKIRLSSVQFPYLSDLRRAFDGGRVDIAFMPVRSSGPASGDQQILIGKTRSYVVLRRDHPLSAQKQIGAAQLGNEPMLILARDKMCLPIEPLLQVFISQAVPLNICQVCGSADELFHRIEAGAGSAVLTQRLAKKAPKQLVSVPFAQEDADWNSALLWKPGNINPCIAPFVEFAKQYFNVDTSSV